MVTIKDIAKLAGVSTSTVSRALNSSGRIDAETQKRIIELANRLNYRPSQMARSLVLRKTKAIMLLVPNIANPFFAELTREISIRCLKHGYKLLLGNMNESALDEKEFLSGVLERVVDGLIAAPIPEMENLPLYMELLNAHFPLVAIDRQLNNLPAHCVVVDNVFGGKLVADFLCRQGHRRIGFLAGDSKVRATHERYQGFLEGLIEHNILIQKEFIHQDLTPLEQGGLERGGAEGVGRLLELEELPTAIFCACDLTALSCISALRKAGKRVPQDVAVVGYDNIDLSGIVETPLTTVSQPKQDIAEQAVSWIIDLIESKQDSKPEATPSTRLLKPELVIRDSA